MARKTQPQPSPLSPATPASSTPPPPPELKEPVIDPAVDEFDDELDLDDVGKGPRRGKKAEPLLIEAAWEAVNQVGGIYTVIRSKLPAMMQRWGKRYCLLGPYIHNTASVEFEEATPTGPFGQAVKQLRDWGIHAHYGHWLVTGRPRAILFDIASIAPRLADIKYRLWEHHGIALPANDRMINDVVLFGYGCECFLAALAGIQSSKRPIIAHFHEWMAGSAIPELRRNHVPVTTVFTTHATLLGRYIAGNDPWYYDHVPFVNWAADAKRFNIEPQVMLERAASHGAHVFTTVSRVTAFECQHLIGRPVDVVTPNGLNIERFAALHEFQNLHRQYKEQIHEFVMGHFFPTYTFDLDKTLYFFISGRYEYRNKGFDMFIESLARLNWKIKSSGLDRTVVAFLVTKRPYRQMNPDVLASRAIMDELRANCDAIKNQIGEKLFYATAQGKMPRVDDLIDEYWRLRLRRTMQAWKTGRLPLVVTHDILDDGKDEVLNQIRNCKLFNNADDRVKIVYHPEFINASNPLWGMDYDQFVRGCHLGVFPSYYEPWGYTPLECAALGVPAITSDVSGFGAYVMENIPNPEEVGLFVQHRRYASFDASANQLAEQMYNVARLDRRDRIALRNRVDRAAEHFDWSNLARYYDEAHNLALQRMT
jgi:glycogen(starch) synthase